jgi:hypothetical protein
LFLKNLKPEEEFRIPKNFKFPFGVQIRRFARLVEDLLSSKFEAKPSQFKRLKTAVESLRAMFDTSANFESQQLDSLRQTTFFYCYFKENSSKERTSLKKKVTPQANKMLKSIES